MPTLKYFDVVLELCDISTHFQSIEKQTNHWEANIKTRVFTIYTT